MKYQNTSQNPTTTNRSITFVANDGALDSNVAVATVFIGAVGDRPELDLDADNSSGVSGTGYRTDFTENAPPVAIAAIRELEAEGAKAAGDGLGRSARDDDGVVTGEFQLGTPVPSGFRFSKPAGQSRYTGCKPVVQRRLVHPDLPLVMRNQEIPSRGKSPGTFGPVPARFTGPPEVSGSS